MKKYGLFEDFALVRKDISRTIIGYGLTPQPDGEHYTWNETVIYKKKIANPTLKQVKDAVEADINAQTDEKILKGFEWTILHGDDEGKTIKVWLSKENQDNFKAKHDAALVYPQLVTFPMTYKVSEDENGNAVYEHFQNIQELAQFYLGGLAYIESCYQAGWAEKDNIDWSEYEEALQNPVIDDFPPEPEPEPEPEPTPEPDEEEDVEPQPEPEDEVLEEEEQSESEDSEEISEEPSEEQSENESVEEQSEESETPIEENEEPSGESTEEEAVEEPQKEKSSEQEEQPNEGESETTNE